MKWAGSFTAFGLLIVALLSHAQEKLVPSPPPGSVATAPAPKDAGKLSPGILKCIECHSHAEQGSAPGFVRKYKSNEFVLLNEAKTWDENDVHSEALRNLDGPLGLRMQAILGRNDKEYSVAKDVRCLTCHSVDLTPRTPLAAKKYDDFATIENGVNCTTCHGLGRNWQEDHIDEPLQKGKPLPWREKSPEDKFNRGMTDLRNPATKARLCVSCHVGNPEEGKEVTHEMYAAGHPPLPPFELASFMESEPKHWGYPTDPGLKFFDEYSQRVSAKERWNTYHFHPASEETYLARNIAVGAIAALGAEMRLIAAEAPRAEGIDFARFDCYACHHELKVPSDRQLRGYEGAPGRVPLKAWISALPQTIAHHAEGLDDGELKQLGAAFTPLWKDVVLATLARPFGDGPKLHEAATKMAAWCDQFLERQGRIDTPVYTPAQSDRLLNLIADAALSERWSADPEAAMHLTWSFLTLRGDLKRPVPAIQVQVLQKVLSTPVRDEKDYRDPKTKEPKPIDAYLKERMNRIANHNAEAFRKAFRAGAEAK